MAESPLTGRLEPQARCSKPLDEEVWRAWLQKNQMEEVQGAIARMRAVKWVCIAILLATAALSSYVVPYQSVVTFIVSLGAIAVMWQGFRTHHYYFAALFTAMVVLYNPLFPTFTLSGGWPRFIVLASVIPFMVSLVWMNATNLPRPLSELATP